MLQAERATDNGHPPPLECGRVDPMVSSCLKAPGAMAKFAKCVDARPGQNAGRLLPNWRYSLTPDDGLWQDSRGTKPKERAHASQPARRIYHRLPDGGS